MLKKSSLLNKRILMIGVFFIFFLSIALNPMTSPVARAQSKSLWIGTNPAGSLFYVLGGGIAKVLSDKTPFQIKVKALGGPVEWLSLMSQGEVDLATINAAAADIAYHGRDAFKEASDGKGFRFMRAMAAGGTLSLSMVAPGDSGIKTIADIKGKKVTYPFRVHTVNNPFVRAALASGGLTEKDIKMVPVGTYPQAVRTVSGRKADVCLGAIGSGVLKELQAARGGITYIPVVTTPEGIAAMKKELPSVVVDYPQSLGGKIACMGTRIMLITTADLDSETVYALTKALYENISELAPIHVNFKSWYKDKLSDPEGVSLPFHEGSIKFYKEKGLWTAQAEDFQKAMLK